MPKMRWFHGIFEKNCESIFCNFHTVFWDESEFLERIIDIYALFFPLFVVLQASEKGHCPIPQISTFAKLGTFGKLLLGNNLCGRYYQKIIHTWINVSYLFMLYLLIRCIGAHNSFSLFMFVYRTDLLYHPLSKKSVSLATLIKSRTFFVNWAISARTNS